ncbi:DUF6438 domain-containing protein [Sphingosinicella sp. BN140058]|uniref:DUF6438 domain-containing protein n=1 Tax=Sphingosinicella sp. BN140058 TaxID=1892855 RepID=UPI0010118BC7|nr:DUF6438 domain-containing protein [Sphingosinicella sp. BN140058]QAY77958.1 hypothetical protein ETR14_16580 [Sphingosinicella sp. BN140058]
MRPILSSLALPLACCGLAACATNSSPARPKAAPADVDRIVYEVGPCHGTCPVYSVSIVADGITYFEGRQHTATNGRAPAEGTPMLFSAVRDSLAAVRPSESETISHPQCQTYATDQQVVTVTWMGSNRAPVSLAFDLGCRDERYGEIRKSLAAARRLLPIDTLVGRVTEF